MKRTASDLVARARARVESLSVDQVVAELTKGDVVLVDVREAVELSEQGRIPGSVWVSRGMLEFHADPANTHHHAGLEPGRRLILYCSDGARSALGAATLQELGYVRVAHLDGGLEAWTRAGRNIH